ncbi:hypothetical protein BC830DRAFT_1080035 [Chytriomyces sp. MP71]|nr:hypothetical protein BC830DRAFT_1080035 [Chytriomyces sp. MP71]
MSLIMTLVLLALLLISFLDYLLTPKAVRCKANPASITIQMNIMVFIEEKGPFPWQNRRHVQTAVQIWESTSAKAPVYLWKRVSDDEDILCNRTDLLLPKLIPADSELDFVMAFIGK